MFLYLKDEDKHVYIPFDAETVKSTLDKGIYNLEKQGQYTFFVPNKSFDKGKLAKAGIFQQVYDYVFDSFSDIGKQVRSQMCQPNRMGLFFKGEPGTGKTFLAARLALDLMEQENGVCIYTNRLQGLDMTEVVDAIRSKNKDRFIIFILDEFEKDYHRLNSTQQDELLAFLDGGKSRDNVLVIATANSLNGIPDTLLCRPGRFAKVLNFSIKDRDIRNNLIHALIPSVYEGLFNYGEITTYVEEAIPVHEITVDKLKTIIHECLINWLKTGMLFSDSQLDSIDSKELLKEINKAPKKRKEKNRKNSWVARMLGEDDDD